MIYVYIPCNFTGNKQLFHAPADRTFMFFYVFFTVNITSCELCLDRQKEQIHML